MLTLLFVRQIVKRLQHQHPKHHHDVDRLAADVASELAGKNVELLRAMVPTMKLLASLRDASNPAAAMQWEGIQKAGRLLGIETRSFDVQSAADVSRAFDVASRDRVDAMYVNVDSVNRANLLQIIGLAAQHKLPAIYSAREFVERGGLATYAVSYPQLYSRTADLADKIFKGTNPADIPFEQPTKFELVINLKTAKALGLTIPETLLATADEVIQ